MADAGKELPTIDFGSMLGSPLVAVIKAQATAAMATVDFIKHVGFHHGEPVTLPFRYRKTVLQPDGTMGERIHEIAVPLLSLVAIPSLRIQETHIDFNAKVVSVQSSNTSTNTEEQKRAQDTATAADGANRHHEPPAHHSVLQVSFAQRQKTSQGTDMNRSYSMNVRIVAVHDEPSAGLERLLSRLEQHTLDQPLNTTAAQETRGEEKPYV